MSAPSPVFAVRGRPTGRGRPRGGPLHAVPGTDRTRTALCGARVGGALRPWPLAVAPPREEAGDGSRTGGRSGDATCPECAALLHGASAA